MARKIRKTINVRTTKKGSQQVLSELKSSLLEQTITGKPTSGLSDVRKNRDYKSLKRNASNQNSRINTFESYSNISSFLGADFSSFAIAITKDELGNTTLDTGPDRDIFEPISRLCQAPDPLVEETVKKQEQEIDDNFFGIVTLVDNFLLPVMNYGSSDSNAPTIPDDYLDVEISQQNSVEKLSQIVVKAVQGTIHGLNREITPQEFKKFPNHYKGLLKSTKQSLRGPGSRVFSNSREQADLAKAETAFTYDMIAKVSFLVGYNKTKEGTPIMSEPIWEDLTEEKYNELSGKTILCKMTPYRNAALGISPNKGFNMQIYHQNFLLVPKNTAPQKSSLNYSLLSSGEKEKTIPVKSSIVTNIRKAEKDIMSIVTEGT